MADRPRVKRIARGLAIAGAALAATLGLLVVGAYLLLQSEAGRALLARGLSDALSTPGELEVSIDRIEGRLPQDIRVSELSVADREGPWLVARAVELRWHPLALLSRELDISVLRAAEIRVRRPPEPAAGSPDKGPGGLPALPVDVAVQELAVDALVLEAPVLGQRADLRLTGKAAAREGERFTSSLVAERTDDTPGRAELAAVYLRGADRLSLEASVNEPSGGLIARALDIPGLPAVAASLSGSGPLRDWRGDLTVTVDGVASASAEVALQRAEAIGFRASGAAIYEGPTARLPWRLLAGDLSFELQGRLGEDRVVLLDRARLDSAALRAELSGRLRLDPLEVEANLTARLSDPSAAAALIAGSAVTGLQVAAQAKGPLLEPTVQAEASAERLTAPGIDARSVTARVSFEPRRPFGPGEAKAAVTVAGEIKDLAADDLAELEPQLGRRYAWRIAGTLDLGRERLDARELSLEAGPVRAAGRGDIGLAEGTVAADLRVTSDDLAGMSPLIGLGIEGRGAADARITATGFGADLDAEITGTASEVRLAEPVPNALLAGRANFAGKLSLAPGGRLTVADLRVESPAARLAGNLELSERFKRIDGAYTATLGEAGVLSKALGLGLKGRADLEGRVQGAVRNPRVEARGTVAEVRQAGAVAGPLRFAVVADDVPSAPRGRVELAATTQAGEFKVSTRYVVARPEVRLGDLRLQGRGTTVSGELTARLDGAPMTGVLTLEAGNLGPWLALAGMAGRGGARGTLHLSADGAGQVAAFDGQVAGLELRLGDGEALRAERIGVRARTADLMGTGAGTASVTATNAVVGELRLDRLDLEAEGGPSSADWRVSTQGRFRQPLALEAAGRLRAGPEGLSLDLARAEGRLLGQPVRLRKAVSVRRRAETTELGPLDLVIGPAGLQARGRIGPDRVFAEANVTGLPIALLRALVPAPGVDGELSGSMTLDGPRDNPTGRAEVKATKIKVEGIEAAPALALDVSAQWRARRLSVTGRVTGLPERDAEVALDMPLVMQADRLAVSVPAGEPVSGRASWHGDVASIWALAPLEPHHLAGHTDLTVTLAGTPAEPKFSGRLRLDGGRYENPDTGTLLKDLTAVLDFDERRVVLSDLSADDGAKGRLRANGSLSIEPDKDFPFDLAAEMTKLTAVRRDDVTAVTDGRLTIEGSLARAKLAGQFTTKSVEVRIVDRLPPDVATLDVREIGIPGQAPSPGPAGQVSGRDPVIDLDMAIAVPRRLFVRGRGLDSEWSGDITITGTTNRPVVEGTMTLVRGQLAVLTKTFRLTKGTATFSGGEDINPVLDVTAEHKVKDLTVTARVSGPTSSPSIRLASTPELPQDEIVSRLLFGKNTAQLSALEAAQLAAAVAELSGSGGRFGNPLDFARGFLGVDVLRVETSDADTAGGPTVEAGKYVTEDIYVGVKKGVTDESGKVGVEVELTPNISVESETGTTGESDIGVKFKWDY